jgi:hypothetical protein
VTTDPVWSSLLTVFQLPRGLGAAIITQRDLSEDQIRQINSVCVLLGLTGFVVSVAVAVPLAVFFRAPDLRGVITVMSLAYVISGFQTAPAALLLRELRFKFLGHRGLQSILQAVVTVLLASPVSHTGRSCSADRQGSGRRTLAAKPRYTVWASGAGVSPTSSGTFYWCRALGSLARRSCRPCRIDSRRS